MTLQGIVDHGHFHCAVQSQKAGTAYFSSKQLLPFGFTEQCSSRLSPLITAHKLNVIFITMPRPGRRRAITLTGTNGARGWQRRDAKGMSIDQVARKEAEARCSSDWRSWSVHWKEDEGGVLRGGGGDLRIHRQGMEEITASGSIYPDNPLTFSLPYMTEISVVIRQWT